MTPLTKNQFEEREAERILRLQCLAAANGDATDGTGLTVILERAQTIYDFVTKGENPD